VADRLRILLDTNILIPLQDSFVVLEDNLKNLIRLANAGGHQLLYHPASIQDINRDSDEARRKRTLARLPQYILLENVSRSPLNTSSTSPNDTCDNDILHALKCDAAHALVSEDKKLHVEAKRLGLSDRTYTIQTAEHWLRRLVEPTEVRLPNVDDVPMHSLTQELERNFFDSLREGYLGFDDWFRSKARTGRRAWVTRGADRCAEAICIYTIQESEPINDAKDVLQGKALKLCTFKVGERVRGRKIGELFLKSAFRYATENRCEHVFLTTSHEQTYLQLLLEDFGFERCGSYGTDQVFVKRHPIVAPALDLPPLDFVRKLFPHYRQDASVQKFIVPIQPQYHKTLFPELEPQSDLFGTGATPGNAIKQAYICKSNTNKPKVGDVVLFYRTDDEKAITSVGVIERFELHDDPNTVMQIVSRRTVYSQAEILKMTQEPLKVMLFRLVGHFDRPVTFITLKELKIVNGTIQSITKIADASFSKLIERSQR
jgi:predicted nucleic acid-binding protein/ribosomal protein S18 acetylase RimI-like enzyme